MEISQDAIENILVLWDGDNSSKDLVLDILQNFEVSDMTTVLFRNIYERSQKDKIDDENLLNRLESMTSKYFIKQLAFFEKKSLNDIL